MEHANATVDSRLDLDEIVHASRAATGLSDVGEPDIMPGLRVLIDAFKREALLHPQGVETQRAALIKLLSNRLRVADIFNRHPEIFEEEIRGPIIITGLVRSGTTKLQRMMAADPELQKLPLWRILNPMPLVEPGLGKAGPGGADPRIAMTEQLSAAMRDHFPDFFAGHPMIANEADEESLMADLAMRGSFTGHATHIPSFDAWMAQQDHNTWYGYLRKMLQLFQWQDGSPQKTWLLKAPAHLGHLESLFEAFPNATVVHCHRDPVTTTASIAQLSEAARRMYSDHQDSPAVGRYVLGYWAGLMRRYMAQRSLLEERHRFVDVAYTEITGQTLLAIERVYAAAGLPLSAQARAEMNRWDASNPPGKHGQHSYSLERFGLSAIEVRAAFDDYLTRFGRLIA